MVIPSTSFLPFLWTEQINLKLSKNLLEVARKYAEIYGYRNIQELAAESIREKVFEDNEHLMQEEGILVNNHH